MPEAGDRRAAGGIDIVAALAVADGDALPRHRHGIVVGEAAVEDMGHGGSLARAPPLEAGRFPTQSPRLAELACHFAVLASTTNWQ